MVGVGPIEMTEDTLIFVASPLQPARSPYMSARACPPSPRWWGSERQIDNFNGFITARYRKGVSYLSECPASRLEVQMMVFRWYV